MNAVDVFAELEAEFRQWFADAPPHTEHELNESIIFRIDGEFRVGLTEDSLTQLRKENDESLA